MFLCFNHFLYKYLKSTFEHELVDYYNLHTLLYKYTGKTDINENEIIDLLNKIKDNLNYQDIIIDEAQDFDSEVIEIFSKYVDENDGKFCVFYDKNQLLFKKENLSWIEHAECKLVLSKNCRNTRQIAVTANNIINTNIRLNDNAIQGEMPSITFIENEEDELIHIEKLITKYKQEGFLNKDITILTLDTERNSILNGYNFIGDNKLVSEINNEDIVFTTSKKFKGLESNAIIIIDIKNKFLLDDEGKRNFYVAASRAKQKLDCIYIGNEEEIKEIANNIIDINNNNDIAKIAMKYKIKPNRLYSSEETIKNMDSKKGY